jgi:hypothetical protein
MNVQNEEPCPERQADLSVVSRSVFISSISNMIDEHNMMLAECTSHENTPPDAVRHLVAAALRRCSALVQGFIWMADTGNRFCAVPLVRLQLDSAMRVHACRLVSDPADFVRHILEGKKPSEYPNRGDLSLWDRDLHTALSNLYPHTSDLYQETNGYVHLSDKHLFGVFEWESLKRQDAKFADHSQLPPWSVEQLKGDCVAMLWATHVLTEECRLLLDQHTLTTPEARVD